MRRFVRIVDGISRILGATAAALVIVLVVLMLYDVVLRYAFNAPTSWGNDLNTFLMGASFVLSIAYALSTDSHVRVDLLYNERTRPRLAYVDLVGLALIVLPAATFISWGLLGHLQEGIRTGERTGSGGWNPVVWPFRAVMLLGFVVFTLQIVAEILKRAAAIAGRPLTTAVTMDEHGV
ncbi:MAG TPA: TRAP transporter small permease subunit [Hyphomicrobiaceae bacterium]|nr:TRAP transporter small permease subunit [Hyphomicrobiaceae bacterium]